MACDEAPAATIGGVNGIENATALNRLGLPAEIDIRSGPTSLVAAEIHLGRGPEGIDDNRPHRNIQVACHSDSKIICCQINELDNSDGTLY